MIELYRADIVVIGGALSYPGRLYISPIDLQIEIFLPDKPLSGR